MVFSPGALDELERVNIANINNNYSSPSTNETNSITAEQDPHNNGNFYLIDGSYHMFWPGQGNNDGNRIL